MVGADIVAVERDWAGFVVGQAVASAYSLYAISTERTCEAAVAVIRTVQQSYLWQGARSFGDVAYGLAAPPMRDIGNTFQAVLYSGWSTQAAHNATLRISDEQAREEDERRLAYEPTPELTAPERDAP